MPDEKGLIKPLSVPVDSIHENLSQVVISTTEDKLRIILYDYEKTLENRKPWIAVLSVFITLVVTLVTSEPNDFLLPKETWRIVFGGAAVATFFWFVSSARRALLAGRSPMSVDDIVQRLKERPQ